MLMYRFVNGKGLVAATSHATGGNLPLEDGPWTKTGTFDAEPNGPKRTEVDDETLGEVVSQGYTIWPQETGDDAEHS
jgi:hypothetical protein